MPTDADIQTQREQLARSRALVRQQRQQAPPDDAALQALYDGIAACKALLRAWGVAVGDQAEDGPGEAGARVEIRGRDNYGAQGIFHGPVQFNNTIPKVNLHALLHDHTGFMQDRLASFVGRVAELREVRRRVAELLPTGGYVTITAQAGQGKSSLIAKLVELALRERCGAEAPEEIGSLAAQAGPATLAYHFIPFSPGPDHQVGLLRNLMTRLILKYNLPDIYVATDSRPALRDYFARVLEEVAACGGQEVIYIDGLDQIEEDASGLRDLSFLPTKPPAGIVFVLGTRPNDTLQPLELRKPHQQYWLPPLSRADFDLVLQHRRVNLDGHLADRFYQVMEANALYLDLVARELAEAGALTPEQIIARIADNPDNLFSLAIDRLKRPPLAWRETLKPILGVLLAAQAPLSAASLRTLVRQDKDTVQDALVRLGGLLARDGVGRYTLFHLKLRDFLREATNQTAERSVFGTDEEESYHQKLADWCEQGGLACMWQDITRDAGEHERRAYARQHLITHLCRAQHWPRLWEVLDQGEYGKAKLRHDPSTRSFVLDLDTVRQAMVSMIDGDFREGCVWLPRLWQYSLLRCSLSSQADNYPKGLIELLAQLGREQEAIGLAEVLSDPKRKAETLVRIGEILGQQGRAAERQQLSARAVEVAREADDSGVGGQAFALVGVVVTLARAKRFDEARVLAQQISNEGRQAFALVGVVVALAKTERFDEARVLAQQITDENRQAAALREVVEALARAERFDEARALAQQITDEGRRAAALRVVVALAKAEGSDEARTLAQQITKEGGRAATQVEVIEVLARAERFDEARALAQQITDEGRRAAALTGVVVALAQARQFDEARALAQEAADIARRLTDEGRRAAALTGVVVALARAERFDEARALTQQIIDEGGRAAALAGVVEVLVQAERFDEAGTLAQQITDESKQAVALAGVVEVLAKAEQFDEARALAQQITDEGRQAAALTGVVVALARAKRFDEARALAQEAADIAHRLTDEGWRAAVLRGVVVALAKAEQFGEARTLAQQITHKGWRAAVLRGVVVALAKAEQFGEARTLAQQITDKGEQAAALKEVVMALAKAEQFDEARALAQQSTNERKRAAALREVVVALARAERFDEAGALAQQITNKGEQAVALTGVVVALARAERFDEARALAQQITNKGEQAAALTGVVVALARAERFDEAGALAQQISDEGKRTAALKGVVGALAKAERFDEAGALAQQISDEGKRTAALKRVVGALAKAERFDEARTLTQQISDEGRRSEALITIAQDQAEVAQWEAIISVIGEAASITTRHYGAISHFLSTLPHLPTVLTLVQRLWSQAQTRDALYALLPAAAPLFIADPTLLPQILAGEEWVKEQLRW